MKLILLASLALSAVAVPTGNEIFKRTTSTFCKKAKAGCANAEENPAVQTYCSAYLGLPPQKTKTFIDLETSTVYTTIKTTTITSYTGSYSGAPPTRTNWQTVTAADASTTTMTTNLASGTSYVFPSQCNGASVVPAVKKRATATQPACFAKFSVSTQISSACGCFTLTATIPATTLIDTTTTISTASMTTGTTTIYGPVEVTSTTTVATVTSTTTVSSQATATGFALQDQWSGNYAGYAGDALTFTESSYSDAATWVLGSNGELSMISGPFQYSGSWQYASGLDFVRFENETQTGYPMNPVTCQLDVVHGSCELNCVNSAEGWTENCIYEVSGDNRNGLWITAPSGQSMCQYVNAPVVLPVPN